MCIDDAERSYLGRRTDHPGSHRGAQSPREGRKEELLDSHKVELGFALTLGAAELLFCTVSRLTPSSTTGTYMRINSHLPSVP